MLQYGLMGFMGLKFITRLKKLMFVCFDMFLLHMDSSHFCSWYCKMRKDNYNFTMVYDVRAIRAKDNMGLDVSLLTQLTQLIIKWVENNLIVAILLDTIYKRNIITNSVLKMYKQNQ